MKQGRKRTMSICLTDLKEKAANKMVKAGNGKIYILLETYDYDEPDKFDHDFSVSVSRNKEEADRVKNGEKIDRVFVGNGRIWEDQSAEQATQGDIDDLPF